MPPTGDCSETESDSLPSDDGTPIAPILPCVFPAWDPRHLSWSTRSSFEFEGVRRDVQTLLGFDMAQFENTNLVSDLLISSARLLDFLTSLPTISIENDYGGSEILAALSVLVDSNLLERMFEYRKFFREATRHEKSIHGYSAVVTWVDEFLVKICTLTRNLASGSLQPPLSAVSESIQSQMDNDAIRAASQLPEDWQDLKIVIGSTHFSPAAKRTALSLMFAAYVMGPRLALGDALQTKTRPMEMLDNLFDAARHMCSRVESSSTTFLHERVAAAMLLSLLPTVDRIDETHNLKTTPRPSQLRPESLGYLLDLIWIIMGKGAGSFLPLEKLDVAQVILLRWGGAVPWSWSTWTDQRNADTEYLCSMTSTWLYHLNRPLFSTVVRSDDDRIMHIDLRRCLFADIAASTCVILQLLQNILGGLNHQMDNSTTSSSPVLGLLGKLCWSTIQYLENDIIKMDDSIHNRIPEYTKCFLLIFCQLRCSQEELVVRDIIIEALSLVRIDWISSCLQTIIQNKSAQFVRKLDQATRCCVRSLSDEDMEREEYCRHLHDAKSLLEFLAIIFSNCSQMNKSIEGTALFYLSMVIRFLKEQTLYASAGRKLLLTPLLSTVCAFEKSRKQQENSLDIEDIWSLSICFGGRNLSTAATFAQFILVRNGPCEPLLCYEAWDLLSSTLTAITDQCISEEEEPLALLTCATICFALKKLICSCSPSTRRSIISSPWTVSLGTTLLVADGTSPTSPYIKKLRTKIARAGMELAKVMVMEPEEISEAKTPADADPSLRLLYYRDSRYSGLIVTSDIGI